MKRRRRTSSTSSSGTTRPSSPRSRDRALFDRRCRCRQLRDAVRGAVSSGTRTSPGYTNTPSQPSSTRQPSAPRISTGCRSASARATTPTPTVGPSTSKGRPQLRMPSTLVRSREDHPSIERQGDAHQHVDGFDGRGSTAGQIGIAWGWYTLSPNWVRFGRRAQARPSSLRRRANRSEEIAVLMTDGDFNTNYCNGVIAQDSGSAAATRQVNCNATNGDQPRRRRSSAPT